MTQALSGILAALLLLGFVGYPIWLIFQGGRKR